MQCDSCHAGCCRAYNLAVTIADVLRIARDLHLAPAEFADLRSYDQHESEQFENQCPGLLFSDSDAAGRKFHLTLRRAESQLTPNTLRCIFLQEWPRATPLPERGAHPGARIIARCGIYTSRPLMCRSFPSVMDAAGLISYLRQPPKSRLSDTHEIYSACPEEWTPEMFANQPDEVAHNHAKDRHEWAFQKLVVAKWNQAPRPQREFFPLMEKVYQARLTGAGNLWSSAFDHTP